MHPIYKTDIEDYRVVASFIAYLYRLRKYNQVVADDVLKKYMSIKLGYSTQQSDDFIDPILSDLEASYSAGEKKLAQEIMGEGV